MWRAMDDRRDQWIRWTNERGFTLAEAIIAAAVGSVILLGLYLSYDVNRATFIRGEQQTDLQQNARIGMDRIVRELRLAGFDSQIPPIIPAPCATAVQSATATSISFIADVDSDGTTEKVEYTYDTVSNPQKIRREEWPSLIGADCTLNWSASGGAQPLAERVTGLTFAYFNEADVCLGGICTPPPNDVPGASLGNIRRISVTITTADTQTGSGAMNFTLRAEVRPRNQGL